MKFFMEDKNIRLDYKIIIDIIKPDSNVLDLGCASGELLLLIKEIKNVRGQGVEIDDKEVFSCVEKGLSVFHGDLDSGLKDYSDKSFDYIILNQTIQQLRNPHMVLEDALRVGKKVIVGIPNFAYYKARIQIFFNGRVPVTPALPYEWYNTPNLHFLSLKDFLEYCKKNKIVVEKEFYIRKDKIVCCLPNFFAEIGIFLIRK